MKKLLSLLAAASLIAPLFIACKPDATADSNDDKPEEEVYIPIKSITLSEESLELTEGETFTLTATIAPENATNKTVRWSSSNKYVASVDNNGLVTAVSTGEAVITAAAGLKKTTCPVIVTSSNSYAKTVPYEEDFEDAGTLEEWTFVDADGDGFGWLHNTYSEDAYEPGFGKLEAHSGLGSMYSASYNNVSQTALSPDNWMFTPPIKLLSNYNNLSFWVAPQDLTWSHDKYAVYIATDTSANAENYTKILEETLTTIGEDSQYRKHIIRIPAQFNGSVVYIAFRHFDCRDQFIMKIDDFSVIGE